MSLTAKIDSLTFETPFSNEGREDISYIFSAIGGTVGGESVDNYAWYLRYRMDGGSWTEKILSPSNTTNYFKVTLNGSVLPYDAEYQVGLAVTSGSVTSAVVYSNQTKRFYSDILAIEFPHMLFEDVPVPGKQSVLEPYFATTLAYHWNKPNVITTYYFTEKENKYLADSNIKKLVYQEGQVIWKDKLKNLPYLNYKIFAKIDGVMSLEPIKTGRVSAKDLSIDGIYDFTNLEGNKKVSLVLELYDVEGSNKRSVLRDSGKTMIKANPPILSNGVEFMYGAVTPIRPLSQASGSTAFNLSFLSPQDYNGNTVQVNYTIRINSEAAPILEQGTLEKQTSIKTIRLPVTYGDDFKNKITQSLYNGEGYPNVLYTNCPLYFKIEDIYGLKRLYTITNNGVVNVEYKEAPILKGTLDIGIDYIKPHAFGITWNKDNVFTNTVKELNTVINSGENIIVAFDPASDLNKGESIYYQIKLLGSATKEGTYTELSIEKEYWGVDDVIIGIHNISSLIDGSVYGVPGKKCAYIPIGSVNKLMYYKVSLTTLNFYKEGSSTKELLGNSLQSTEYIVGCPIAIPTITIGDKTPEVIKQGDSWVATTTHNGEQIYKVNLGGLYNTYKNLERKISYNKTGAALPISYRPKAELILQYANLGSIDENDGISEKKIIENSFLNDSLIITLTRNLGKQPPIERLFFRIKMTITTGLGYDESKQQVITKTLTVYSNIVIYSPTGPTVSHRFHSVGINKSELDRDDLVSINYYNNKTQVNMTGKKVDSSGGSEVIRDFNILFDLNGGVFEVDNIDDIDFLITTADIEKILNS